MKRMVRVAWAGSLALALMSPLATSTPAGQQAAAAVSAPTYTADVAPILFKNCAGCHRPGEIGPMSFLSYESTRPWARSIKEKVVSREMPPWAADPASSMKMRNDRSLSPKEIDTIVAWVNAGAPKGNPADMPPAPTFATGWQLGEPDFVFEQPVEWDCVRPDGQEPYLDPTRRSRSPRTSSQAPSRFARATSALCTTRACTSSTSPKATRSRTATSTTRKASKCPPPSPWGEGRGLEIAVPLAGADKLISYVPGRGYEKHPDGFAKRIPAGKYICWVMHYNPTGQAEKDRSRVGIWFAKGPVKHEVLNLQAGDPVPGSGGRGLYFAQNKEVVYESDDTTGRRGKTPPIPPYTENWKLIGITPVNEPITLYALTPHMHFRGKRIKWRIT